MVNNLSSNSDLKKIASWTNENVLKQKYLQEKNTYNIKLTLKHAEFLPSSCVRVPAGNTS